MNRRELMTSLLSLPIVGPAAVRLDRRLSLRKRYRVYRQPKPQTQPFTEGEFKPDVKMSYKDYGAYVRIDASWLKL